MSPVEIELTYYEEDEEPGRRGWGGIAPVTEEVVAAFQLRRTIKVTFEREGLRYSGVANVMRLGVGSDTAEVSGTGKPELIEEEGEEPPA